MKTCSRCRREFPTEGPNRFFNKKRNGFQPWCKECNRKRSRQYYADNREKHIQIVNDYRIKNRLRLKCAKYGITEEEYLVLYKQQGGLCGICRKKISLVIDHDHTTGNVRGLLCGLCNIALGGLGDTVEQISAALNYLVTYQESLG